MLTNGRRMLPLFIALTVLMAGCGDLSGQGANLPAAGNGQADGERAEAERGALADDASAIVIEARTLAGEADDAQAMLAFLDEHMPQASPDEADELLLALLGFYAKDVKRMEDAFAAPDIAKAFGDAGYPAPRDIDGKLADEAAARLVARAAAGGYKLETAEGMYYPVVDYSSLKEAYGAYLTADMRAYVSLKALESDDKTASDAALAITWDQLAERTLAAEAYLTDFRQGRRFEEVQAIYSLYLMQYVYGFNNTPIADETSRLREEVGSSYRRLAGEHPDTVTGGIVGDYVALIDSLDGKLLDDEGRALPAIRQFRDSLSEQIRDRFAAAAATD